MDTVFFAKVEKGKILFSDKDLLKSIISYFEGKDIDVIVRAHRKDRSNLQNRYYWVAVIGIPAKHFGYLPSEMHNAFKMIFLRKFAEGKPETVCSTKELSTVEFAEYMEKCIQWCAENSIYIPD